MKSVKTISAWISLSVMLAPLAIAADKAATEQPKQMEAVQGEKKASEVDLTGQKKPEMPKEEVKAPEKETPVKMKEPEKQKKAESGEKKPIKSEKMPEKEKIKS